MVNLSRSLYIVSYLLISNTSTKSKRPTLATLRAVESCAIFTLRSQIFHAWQSFLYSIAVENEGSCHIQWAGRWVECGTDELGPACLVYLYGSSHVGGQDELAEIGLIRLMYYVGAQQAPKKRR